MPNKDLALLLRLNQSWYHGIPADQLYEVTRAWWVMSSSKAQRVARVLAIGNGVVREVYEPSEWMPSTVDGLENRIGFNGGLASDRDDYVGRDVAHLFRPGSANPVRYVPLSDLAAPGPPSASVLPAIPSISGPDPDGETEDEPGLLERVLPLLRGFEGDLVWAQSLAAQELFHSNTLAWLLNNHPAACRPLLEGLGSSDYSTVEKVVALREKKNLDIVIDPVGASPKIVLENKLYSIPYEDQLVKYNPYKLPWSDTHGAGGAADTRYVLLSLMTPAFALPAPWVHVDYSTLAEALDLMNESDFSRSADLFARYRSLVRRLVALSEAVDPRQNLAEPFSVAETVEKLPTRGLDGAVAKLRFSDLAQEVQRHFDQQRHLTVGGDRGGIITYFKRFAVNRKIGWQFQDNQLRYQITIEDTELQGESKSKVREGIVERQYLEFFDHTDVASVLGSDLKAKNYHPGEWNKFNPDFVYRHRPIKTSAPTDRLAQALVVMTKRVDEYAERFSASPA